MVYNKIIKWVHCTTPRMFKVSVDLSVGVSVDFRAKCKNGTVNKKHGLWTSFCFDVYCLQQAWSTTKGWFCWLLFATNMVYNWFWCLLLATNHRQKCNAAEQTGINRTTHNFWYKWSFDNLIRISCPTEDPKAICWARVELLFWCLLCTTSMVYNQRLILLATVCNKNCL